MPKMVTELAQGNGFSRSADGGRLADQATRVFKVLLNTPNESWLLDQAVGVSIGDVYSDSNPIPCVSLEARADGESRLVRIVTVQYRSNTGGDGGSGGEDPGTYQPDVRPANFSTSTSLYEAPAYKWIRYGGNTWEAICNPLGDPLDGISKMDAITTIRVTQFQAAPGTVYSEYCGSINDETMNMGGYLTCRPHTVLFRGVEASPHVESFGSGLYRGFMNSYEFAYRPNFIEGMGECGWDVTPLLTGFNVKAFTPNAVGTTNDNFGQPLKYKDYVLVKPLELPTNISSGDKVRAMVKITNLENGDVSQQPSAQPVALNEDGTPRNTDTQNPKVIIWRGQVQRAVNLTNTLQLRLN